MRTLLGVLSIGWGLAAASCTSGAVAGVRVRPVVEAPSGKSATVYQSDAFAGTEAVVIPDDAVMRAMRSSSMFFEEDIRALAAPIADELGRLDEDERIVIETSDTHIHVYVAGGELHLVSYRQGHEVSRHASRIPSESVVVPHPERKAKADADGDGLPDRKDSCPGEAGPRDLGGCPARDSDGDGLFDDVDGCRGAAEDPDGFEDTDGCPDRDNDGDRIADGVDRCPLEPGLDADGGCPAAVVVHDDKVVVDDGKAGRGGKAGKGKRKGKGKDTSKDTSKDATAGRLSPDEVRAKLKQLDQLRAKDLITEAEYQKKREELLDHL